MYTGYAEMVSFAQHEIQMIYLFAIFFLFVLLGGLALTAEHRKGHPKGCFYVVGYLKNEASGQFGNLSVTIW